MHCSDLWVSFLWELHGNVSYFELFVAGWFEFVVRRAGSRAITPKISQPASQPLVIVEFYCCYHSPTTWKKMY